MAKVTNALPDVQNCKSIEELRRFTAAALNAILLQLNGKLDFGDNIRTSGPLPVVLSGTAPTKVFHTLNRVPQGIITTSIDGANVVITPDKTLYPWTSTQLFVQGISDGNAEILVF